MDSYNAVDAHEQSKKFESYLIIKGRIEKECKIGLQETLAKLDIVYQTSGSEYDLMDVLRGIRN